MYSVNEFSACGFASFVFCDSKFVFFYFVVCIRPSWSLLALKAKWIYAFKSSCVLRFLPFPASLPACRLAGPCVKGGCCRTDCGNSRSASPVPYSLTRGAAINPRLLEPLPAHTSPQPTHSLPNNPRKQFHLDSGGGPLSPTPSIFPN